MNWRLHSYVDKQKLQDCFNAFAEDVEGEELYAYVSQLPSMIEYLHYPLPDNFVETTYIQFQLKDNQKFNFDKFCEFLAPRHRDTEEWVKLFDAFEVFDSNGNGKISISDLSEILSTFGQIFTTDEINHMRAITKPDENDLVDILLVTDLLIDDMFDSMEEEEEEEMIEVSNNNAQQTDSYKLQSNELRQQYNENDEQPNGNQQQFYDDQYQEQSNDYQEQSGEYQEQFNEYQEQNVYQNQFIEEEEEEVDDINDDN